MKRIALPAAALGIGLAVALPLAADARPGGMHHGGWGHGGFGGPERMCDNQQARMAGMLAFAKEKLGITQQQEAAWTKFADTVRSSQQPMAAACAQIKDKPAPATLPERVERMQTMMSARAAQFEAVVPALKEMYAQLTPEQQKTANEMMNRGRMGGPGGPGPGPGGPGMGPGGPGMGPGQGPGRQGG